MKVPLANSGRRVQALCRGGVSVMAFGIKLITITQYLSSAQPPQQCSSPALRPSQISNRLNGASTMGEAQLYASLSELGLSSFAGQVTESAAPLFTQLLKMLAQVKHKSTIDNCVIG